MWDTRESGGMMTASIVARHAVKVNRTPAFLLVTLSLLLALRVLISPWLFALFEIRSFGIGEARTGFFLWCLVCQATISFFLSRLSVLELD